MQSIAFLDVIHGALGIVPSGALPPLMQWGGRIHYRNPPSNSRGILIMAANLFFFHILVRENGILEFAKVLRVQEQVVAGKLYHMTLVAVDGGMKKIYEAKTLVAVDDIGG